MEVNLTPSLVPDSDMDFDVKSNLISDLFTLAGIPNLYFNERTKLKALKNKDPYQTKVKDHLIKKNFLKDTSNPNILQSWRSVGQLSLKQPEIKRAIKVMNEENDRRWKFDWIFPNNRYKYYSQFFEEERMLNKALSKYLFKDKMMLLN